MTRTRKRTRTRRQSRLDAQNSRKRLRLRRPSASPIGRIFAGIVAVLITIAMIAFVAWVWTHWDVAYHQRPWWELVLWALAGAFVARSAEVLGWYALSGDWLLWLYLA